MKYFKATLVLMIFFSLSSCASYNSVAPDWAKIGVENSESASDSGESDEKELPWWNPASWF